jgi:hypothetical protein
MKRISYVFPVILAVIILCTTESCADKKLSKKKITKIVYSYGDASVPPKYHRSYTITATKDEIRIVVDSYGNILADTTYQMDKQKFDVLSDKLCKTKLKNKKKTEDTEGCTGGTSRYIKVFSGENIVLNGYAYFCGGEIFGDLDGDINSFAAEIKSFIPDIDKLLE